MYLSTLSKFVYGAGLYNIALAAGMAVPTVHRALGINIADPASVSSSLDFCCLRSRSKC
jgi:hypothetical protein